MIGGKQWNGVKHDFNLNFNNIDPEVEGIYGIEQAYIRALNPGGGSIFALSGPTLFQPILRKSHNLAKNAHAEFIQKRKINPDDPNNPIQYFILLIITDGIINDMKQTKDEIVAIANERLPLSIIIVGVGNADFSKMDELDGDDQGLMNSKGAYAQRDIVQFVPMNKFQRLSELSKETLMEIPDQFLSYVRSHDISPVQKPEISVDNYQYRNKYVSNNQNNEQKDDDDDGWGKLQRLQTFNENILQGIDLNYENAPLPPGWEKAYDESGRAYYVDHNNGKTQWVHPSQPIGAK